MRNIIETRALLAAGLMCACVGAPRCVTAGVNAWTPIGPDGGRIHDVEFSRTDSGTFYAIGRAGVYRSTIAGDSFELLKEDFVQAPFDLAVDPTQPDRVLVAADGLYAGAGPDWRVTRTFPPDPGTKVATSHDGATVYFAAGTRIFRSLDRGVTLQERASISGAPPQLLVNGLATDPTNANVVYANVYGLGLFASSDGGATWREPAITRVLSFVVDPSSPLRLLAATENGLYISDDGALTWNSTTMTSSIWDVEVDPLDPRVIYVSGDDVRKSTDSGVTWQVLPVDQPSGTLRLAIDPTQPSRLAAFGGEGVSVSTDSGATWAKRIAGFKGTDTSAFSALASSRRNYFGVHGRGGVYYVEPGESVARSVNNDPVAMLASAPQGLIRVQVLALPGAADTLYAVLDGEVLAKSADAGLHWSQLPFPGSSVTQIAGSPLEPRTLYAAGSPDKVYKSLDAGASWTASGGGLPDGLQVGAIAIASIPSTLYASGVVSSGVPGSPAQEWGLYRSADGGATWLAASPPQTSAIQSITVDPNDPLVVYAGLESALRKTADGGASWTELRNNAFPVCCEIGGVVFDPTNPNVFYAQPRAAVWRTVDAGASWESVPGLTSGASSARGTLALDPANASRLLVGWTELGVRELTIAPDLGLTITAPTSLTANTVAGYTLTLRNLGPFHATNVHVTAQLPAGATGASASAAGAPCTIAATTATCTFDVVRSGGSATAIALGFVPAAGSVNVSASTAGDQPDPLTVNNAVTSTLVATVPAPPASSGGGGSVSPAALALLVVFSLLKARMRRSPAASAREAGCA